MKRFFSIKNILEKPRRQQVITWIALIGALFHLWVLGLHPMSMWPYRAIHLMFGTVILIMSKPFTKKEGVLSKVFDYLLILCSIGTMAYIVIDYTELAPRIDLGPTTMDLIVCGVGIVVLLEATRRANGATMPILAIIFMLYAKFGKHLPGILGHRGYTWRRLLSFEYGVNSVFGISLGVSATYVILFVIFGAVLEGTGGGRLFIEAAISAFGKSRGGPAKAAVFASAGMGMINGTAAGNVVTTGAFTIPLMRRIGYKPEFAGAVEAVASTGGQIMPPIMGAAAFIVAETLAVNYSVVARSAIIPAVLYFTSVYVMVDVEAQKTGLTGVKKEDLPKMKAVLQEVGHLAIPLLLLLYMLIFTDYSPLKAALVTICVSFIIAMLRKTTRYTIGDVIAMLAKGMKDSCGVILACGCAGLIVGVLSLTGLGSKIAAVVVSLSGGHLLLALFFSMIVTIIMGMGLPTTASYIICSSVVAPALIKLGVEPLAAHLFVFYFACLSSITPPVAIAAYAASGLTGASASKTGWRAFALGLAAFVVPYMFVYSNSLLMIGSVGLIIRSAITAFVGTIIFAYAVTRWFIHKANPLVAALLLAASLLMISSGLTTDLIGIGIAVVCFLLQKYVFKPKEGEIVQAGEAVSIKDVEFLEVDEEEL